MRLLWICLAAFVTNFSFAQNKKITLEDIWGKGTFSVKSVPGFNALQDGKRYSKLESNSKGKEINIYDLAHGEKIKTVFESEKIQVQRYQFSKDESKLLLFEAAAPIYRRSVLYKVHVYDINSGNLQLLDEEKVLHAQFSPDGKKVAFVKNNNIFYKDLQTNKTIRVTTDGKRNEIINGNCDWVYEEEFGFTQAYQWSPDGKYLAYYRFDERQVPEYVMTVYDKLHPTPYTYKYPKAGEPNSIIQIKIYHIAAKKTLSADIGKETDIYIPRIKWSNHPEQLCIYRLNRHQNHLELLLANAATGRTQKIYDETNEYYIDINDELHFLKDNGSFVFSSERNGYNHFYKWNWKTQQLMPLTKGNYDVEKLIGVNEAINTLYYTAAEKSPLQRQLYAVDLDGKNKQLLTPEEGTHSITAINGYQFFMDKFSSLHQPPVYYLRDKKGAIVRILEDNKKLVNTMQEYALGKLSFMQVEGADKKTQLNGWIITPPDFDERKKYPLLMYQYSGPGSQQVADKFPLGNYFWHQMLAQKGYIVACVDGIGTGFRGEKFKKKTYLQLGKLESDDQIAVARHLGALPFVDENRIGIWGWSFGGFMSSTCIFKGNDIFKTAIAVAPVSNWRYYDNIYTERFMRTPEENPEGYDENAPEKMVDRLKGNFLVIHGTGDDNVHFQNQVELVDALIEANKEFDSEYYPDRAHGISGGNSHFHVYQKMTAYILESL